MKSEMNRDDLLIKWMREVNELIKEAGHIQNDERREKRIRELEKLRNELGNLR